MAGWMIEGPDAARRTEIIWSDLTNVRAWEHDDGTIDVYVGPGSESDNRTWLGLRLDAERKLVRFIAASSKGEAEAELNEWETAAG